MTHTRTALWMFASVGLSATAGAGLAAKASTASRRPLLGGTPGPPR